MMGLDAAWALIFGGCCSNVFALEAIIKHEPGSGLLITVLQFIFTALYTLPSQLTRSPYQFPTPPPSPSPSSKHTGNGSLTSSTLPSSTPFSAAASSRSLRRLRLKRPILPPSRLATMSLMFFAVNMLNNWAFAFDISVPLHIILRSFGSVTTLACGWAVGKRYSKVQVASVAALTVGVCVSAWADASAKGKTPPLTTSTLTSTTPTVPVINPTTLTTLAPGLFILLLAQLISAYMGIYTETTYARHGRHWRETLFYSHALGLAFSLFLLPSLIPQAKRLFAADFASRSSTSSSSSSPTSPNSGQPSLSNPYSLIHFLPLPAPLLTALTHLTHLIPPAAPYLALNAITQVACISGVNRLSSQTTAVTVTIVLNIRKLASFLLSCVIFGNRIGGLMGLGAAVVFLSGGVYGWDGSRRRMMAAGTAGRGGAKADANGSENGNANGTAGLSLKTGTGGVSGSEGGGAQIGKGMGLEGIAEGEPINLDDRHDFTMRRKRTVEIEAGTGGDGGFGDGSGSSPAQQQPQSPYSHDRKTSATTGHVHGYGGGRKVSGRYVDGKLA